MAKTSVIITTYNRPDALAAVLEGFKVQSQSDFEVVIADDGSTEDTADLIGHIAGQMPFRTCHVWQDDKGFRAAAARNRGIAASSGDYVIFVDGDCIPFPDFIATHLRLAESGWFVAGNRILMNPSFTRRVLAEKLPVYSWGFLKWVYTRLRGSINRLVPLLRLPDGTFRKRKAYRWDGAKTCNLAVWRQDLLKINGFDERYQGWGHEDADLVVRLIRAKVRRKEARFAVPVLHLWHPDIERIGLSDNVSRLQDVLHGSNTVAQEGLHRHME
ncbi:MAG: glycosyltransferase family 2 protein [Candidatus Binatia bacterium]